MPSGEHIWAGIIGAAVIAGLGVSAYSLGWIQISPSAVTASPSPSTAPQGPPPERGVIEAVVDSITLRLTTGHIIRYMGVETPSVKDEVQCFGKEALIANESVIGQEVRLEEEPLLLRSRDGAWTRYVFMKEPEEEATEEPGARDEPRAASSDEVVFSPLPDSSPVPTEAAEATESETETADESNDEIFINERILEGGFGFPVVSEDMKYGERLLSAARFSSATGKGLWSRCEIEGEAPELSTQTVTECVIKGKTTESGAKFYRTSECPGYKDTIVLQSEGGQWFCSEDEAREAGFEKAEDCE